MTVKELKRRYQETVKRVETAEMFDGRGKGVDVYVCRKCGAVRYTRYKDKGVTPFTLLCEEYGCLDVMMHESTIPEWKAMMIGATVHNWVRPTFEWLDKQRKKGRFSLIEHVLDGGLILDSELMPRQPAVPSRPEGDRAVRPLPLPAAEIRAGRADGHRPQ